MDFSRFVGVWILIWFIAWIASCGIVHIISVKIERKRAEKIATDRYWRIQNYKNIIKETRDI